MRLDASANNVANMDTAHYRRQMVRQEAAADSAGVRATVQREQEAQGVALEKEAVGAGFRFLTRLINEWHSGANRFDAPGECLMAAYLNQQLIGIGGLSVDPYADNNVARLRRV